MLDAIIFEKLGVPAAAIITTPFEATCHAMADLQAMPDYRFVQVEHPITSLTHEQLRERARYAAPYVEALLVEGVPWPETDPGSGDAARGRSATEATPAEQASEGALAALVEELAVGLRADGADLTGERTDEQTVRFTLHIPDQACADCIMPAPHLLPIFERRTAEHLGTGIAIVLDDPRITDVAP